MRLFLSALAALGLLSACNDAGRFAQKVGGGGPQEPSEDRRASDEDPTATGIPDSDKADEPQLITGTYLTCVETGTERNPDRVYMGCRLAREGTGETVPLKSVATSWQFMSTLPPRARTLGISVEEKAAPPATSYAALFVFSGASLSELRAAVAETRVTLDLELRPEASAGGEGQKRLETIGPKGSADASKATQTDDGEEPSSGRSTPNSGGGRNPGSKGGETSDPGGSAGDSNGSSADADEVEENDSADAPNRGDANETRSVTNDRSDTQERRQVDDDRNERESGDPVIHLYLAQKANGFEIRAAPLRDAKGVVSIEAGDVSISLESPSHLQWTLPITVILQKGDRVCRGETTLKSAEPAKEVKTICAP